MLSGDVHHAYLAEVAFRQSAGARAAVYQATCSPFRNGLTSRERRMVRLASLPLGPDDRHVLCRSAGVPPARIRWRIDEGPWFDNQVATLDLDGPSAHFRLEKTHPDDWREATLHDVCRASAALISRLPELYSASTPHLRGRFFLTGGTVARGDVRIAVTLACEDCKRRNYQTKKSKRNNPDRIELRKYCRWCGKHTPHKETR